MTIEARSRHPRGAATARRLARRAAAFLAALRRPEAGLSILVVTDAQIRWLNRRWRAKDRATDVLSRSTRPNVGSVASGGRSPGSLTGTWRTASSTCSATITSGPRRHGGWRSGRRR